MARSQTSFNKKEKEKKKLQKRKEKEEKRIERKATAVKGGHLEDMLAYVDENGNITSTPPDPMKRIEVDVESIEIGVPRRAAEEAPSKIRKGKVTFFNQSKSFGFIKDDETQESVFVHANALLQPVRDNDKVQFEVEMTSRGTNALKVKKI
jgi:cold shock CspA family protein